MSFKFCETAKHSEHQSAMRRRGVRPPIGQGFECCASLADCIESVEQIACRSRQPIELAHDQRIAIAKRLDCLC
jgi:hypothetical protein